MLQSGTFLNHIVEPVQLKLLEMPSYVIVGASRGLGVRHFAERLPRLLTQLTNPQYEWLKQLSLDPANTVVGLARTPSAVEAKLAADKIKNVHVIAADLVDNKSLTEAAAKVSKLTHDGSLDYLIVNGVYQNPKADFLTPTEFVGREGLLHDYMVEAMEVNVIGVMYAINAFIPLVRKSSIKRITVISTGLADTELERKGGVAFFVTYSATKAALNTVVAKYSVELRDEGIIFLALSPGLVSTKDTPRKCHPVVNLETIMLTDFEAAPEYLDRIGVMMNNFVATYPHFKGPITPAESVVLQKRVIEHLDLKDSGSFLSHLGSKQWL